MLAKKKMKKRTGGKKAGTKKVAAAPKSAVADTEAPEFVPLPRMTHVVYRSSKFETAEIDGAKSVVATEPIVPGDVLLVEHVVSGSADYALNCVLNDGPLFDVLYPRTTTWSVDRLLADELESTCVEKVDANGFVSTDGTVAIGSDISAFNHGDTPAAVVSSLSLATDEDIVPPRMLYVLACAAVQPGDEVRIRYGDAPSELHPYVAAAEPQAGAGVEPADAPDSVAAPTVTSARKVARGWTGASEAEPAVAATVGARKAARGWRSASGADPGAGREDDAAGADLQAGVEAVRGMVVEYAATEEFVNLCVAQDRLRRALAEA